MRPKCKGGGRFANYVISLDIVNFIIIFFLYWISSGRTRMANSGYNELERETCGRGRKLQFFFIVYLSILYFYNNNDYFVLKYHIKIVTITLPHISGSLWEEQALLNWKEPQRTNYKSVGNPSKILSWELWTSTSPLTASVFVQNGFPKNPGSNFRWAHFTTLVD